MTKPAKILTCLAFAAAIALGVLYGKGLLSVHEARVKPASLAVLQAQNPAKVAPDVVFVDAAGGRHALSAFKGRYVLLNMWATWCAPCVAELPALARLKAQVPGLAVLAVDIWKRDTPSDIDAFLKNHQAASLGTLADADNKMIATFAAVSFPTTLLIDPSGKIVARAEGPAAWDSPDVVAYFKEVAGG